MIKNQNVLHAQQSLTNNNFKLFLMKPAQKVLSISLVLMHSFLLSGCPDQKKKKGSASSKSVYGTPTTKPGKPTSIKP